MRKHLVMISMLIQELSGQLQRPEPINTYTHLYSHRTISKADSPLHSSSQVGGTIKSTTQESCVQT